MRKLSFNSQAQENIQDLLISEHKLVKKIFSLIADIQKHPFEGIGKPEALKNNYSGYWSRRITEKHRLVYQINDEEITIIACKDHYDDK
jgi:toxin YoeB